MKHTKGAWRYTIIGMESKVVDEKIGIIAHLENRNTLEEIEANARLIAQAPRMAELLEWLVGNGWNAGVSEEAKEILAKLK